MVDFETKIGGEKCKNTTIFPKTRKKRGVEALFSL